MKKLFALSIIFITAAMMAVGCEDKKDNKKDLATMMILVQNAPPRVETTGDQQDVSDATGAAFAVSPSMFKVINVANPGSGMMPSVMTDPNTPLVKGAIKESILAAVNANAVEKMQTFTGGCNADETDTFSLTAAISGTGYTINPNIQVSYTYKCNASADPSNVSGSMDVSIHITGSISTTFNDMDVQVFDVNKYKNTGDIDFRNIILNGTVAMTEVDITTTISIDAGLVFIFPRLNIVVNNLSGVKIVATDLYIDSNPDPVSLDLNVAEEVKFKFSIMGLSFKTSISVSVDAEGTVGGNDVAFSYGFNSRNLLDFDLSNIIGVEEVL